MTAQSGDTGRRGEKAGGVGLVGPLVLVAVGLAIVIRAIRRG